VVGVKPELIRGGHRALLLASAGRAVLRAWDGNDEAGLAEAMIELRSVLPTVPEDYDPRPYIAAQTWTFAKTMPTHPHEYCMLKGSTDWQEHLRFADWVRFYGQVERFQGRSYRYCDVDGWHYWVLGPNDTIINRARLEPAASVQLDL
jgi:hypothetical protein